MQGCEISLAGVHLTALGSGALWWDEHKLLCVSDLHLGKSERILRLGGAALPPYETRDTLSRIEADLEASNTRIVVCLGDSFDDMAAAQSLNDNERAWIARLQTGRRWIWIEGNHDPEPINLGGDHLSDFALGPLTFRHIANPDKTGEISGHYHPKVQLALRGKTITRSSFLCDRNRIILPAFGTYTGGLASNNKVLCDIMCSDATAIMTGPTPHQLPMPR